jgi:hypothetical protein
MQTLTSIPARFAAGTTVKYRRSPGDYPASDGWTLTLYLNGVVSQSYVASVVNGEFEFTLPASSTPPAPSTAALITGNYIWTETASKAGEGVFDYATGMVEVTPDVRAATGNALQSKEEQELVLVDLAIKVRLGGDVGGSANDAILKNYRIGDRGAELVDLDVLYKRRAYLRAVIRSQRRPGQFSTPVRVAFVPPSS